MVFGLFYIHTAHSVRGTHMSKYDKISVFSGRLKKLDVKNFDFEVGFERRNTQIEHTWPRVKTPLLVKTGQLQLTLPFLSQIKITTNFQTDR